MVAQWGGRPGGEGALLLHGHIDVVPAAAEDWQVDPFAGEIRDGYLWGRGAVDMKNFDAMLLSVCGRARLLGRVPERPIVLCFTADEEAGGMHGAQGPGRRSHRPPCALHGGDRRGRRLQHHDPRPAAHLIEAAEKGMAWLKLTARGRAGHGSMINTDNAVNRLTAAVARIGAHEWPVRLTPAMEVLLATVGEMAGMEATPENAEALVEEFGGGARMVSAVIRNTCNPTMLQAGYKVNVCRRGDRDVDGRFLPGYEDEFFETLAELCGEGIESSVSHQQPWETPYDGDLVDTMTRSLLAEDPRARVAPYLLSAGTDAKHFPRSVCAATGSPVDAAGTTSTSPRCSTASTSGCRSTHWPSGRG